MRRIVVLVIAALLPAGVATAGDPALGRAKSIQCRTCHGNDGVAVAPDAGNLAGQQETYLVNQLKAFRSGKRPSEQMNLIARQLSDQDIEDLAAWYASFTLEVTIPE